MEFPILAANPGAIAIASVFFFAAAYFFNRWKTVHQTYQLMLDTKPSPIAAISEGPCEFQGKIGNVEPPLVSPWSQQKCVYYDLDVEEWQTSGSGSSRTSGYCSVFNDQQVQRFTVTDISGSVEINPYKGRFHMKIDRRTHTGSLNNASPELQTLLRNRYGNPISSQGWFGTKGKLRFTEKVLAVGDPGYIFGEAKREGYEGVKLTISDGVMPLIISEEGQQNSERMHYFPDRNLYVAGMVASGLLAILLFAVGLSAK